jgi:hypothetical protein
MYSILIRDEKEPSKWTFYLDENEAVWEGSKADAQAEITKILATVTLGRIKVVHNTTLTGTFTVTDVE